MLKTTIFCFFLRIRAKKNKKKLFYEKWLSGVLNCGLNYVGFMGGTPPHKLRSRVQIPHEAIFLIGRKISEKITEKEVFLQKASPFVKNNNFLFFFAHTRKKKQKKVVL